MYRFSRVCFPVLMITIAAIGMAVPALAQTSEEIAAQTRRIQAEILDGHRAALARGQIEAEISALRELIAYQDGCLAKARGGNVVVGTEYGCVVIPPDEFVRLTIHRVLTGELELAKLESYISTAGFHSVEVLRRSRAGLQDRLDDANRRWADVRAPKITHLPDPQPDLSSASSAGCVGFTGRWSTYGGQAPMTISGSSGTYVFRGIQSTVSGSISGNKLSGTYTQPGYPQEQWTSGRFEFVLSPDGNSFSGIGWDKYGKASDSWNGTCVGPPQ